VVEDGPDRVQLMHANQRVVESRRDSQAARAAYTGHVHTHGC
jgi:hypothetical protein